MILIGKEGNRNFVLINDFNILMYDHTSYRGRKHFCRFCLQAFSTEEILKRHIKDCLKINRKHRIIIPKKGDYVKLKIHDRKIKLPFMTYADFQSILVP